MKTQLYVFQKTFFAILLTLASVAGWGQTIITTLNTAIKYDFNGFTVPNSGATTNNPFTGWTITGTGTNGGTWQGTNQVSGTSGGWYSSNNLSFLGSSSATAGTATWTLRNNTGSTITKFDLSFIARMWKSGSNSPKVIISYGINTTTTFPGSFTQISSFDDTTTNITFGQMISVNGTTVNIPNGSYVFIRFVHAGGSSSDNLGWDDVSFTPNPVTNYTVIYNGNGNTGGSVPLDAASPYAPGSNVNVLGNTGNLVKTGHKFVGWTTDSANTGTVYNAGDTYSNISANTTFYAKWDPVYTVNYDGNGNTGGAPPTDPTIYDSGATVTVLGNTGSLVQSGYTFNNWNTASNGSGTPYTGGNTFNISSNQTLYAQWTQNAVTTLSDNTPQVTASNVFPGTDNVLLSQFKLAVANQNTSVTEVSVLYDGTYTATDIKANGLKLWYSATNNFASATVLASKNSTSTGSGEVITFDTLSQGITTSNTGYFWVTADISNAGVMGHTINLANVAAADIHVSAGTITGTASTGGVKTITTNDTLDYYRMQWPGTLTVPQGQTTAQVYGEAYKGGVTDVTSSMVPAIQVWIGVSPIGVDTNPNSWAPSTWTLMTFQGDVTDAARAGSDNYSAAINTLARGLALGTYRYAVRFQYNGGPYTYGGFNTTTGGDGGHGGPWDGVINISGVLTVTSNKVQYANIQSPDQSLTITQGQGVDVFSRVSIESDIESAELIYSTVPPVDESSFSTWTALPMVANPGYTTGSPGYDATRNENWRQNFGAALSAGTYYYVSRYKKMGSSEYVYGGNKFLGNPNEGGIWDGTTYNAGVLIIQTPPEINIRQAANIANNGTYTVATSQSAGTSSAPITFTIDNLGQANLTLETLVLGGTNASEFSIIQPMSSTIGGGANTTFTLTFSPTTSGAKTATLTLPNNDGDESPYTITINATAGPENDLCGTASLLTVNAAAIIGTMVNANVSTPYTSGKDVWYKFTTNCDGKHTINLTGYSGSMQLYLYAACPTTQTHLQNVPTAIVSNKLVTSPLTTNTIYFIRVVANNVAAEESSFNISVNNQITIATQPVDITINQGQTTSFSTSIPDNAQSYQWQVSTDGGTSWSNVVGGTGGTINSYTIPTSTMAMNGNKYHVIIKNGTCNEITSNPATLTVNPATISTDMFRSKSTGDWDAPATWMSSSDNGVTWLDPATAKPTGSATSIEIMNGHIVTTWRSEGAKNLTVHSGASLNLRAPSLTNSGVFKVEDNATVLIAYTSSNLSTNLWAGTEDFEPESIFKVTVMAGSGANLFTVSGGVPAITSNTYNGYTAMFGNLELTPGSGWSAFLPNGANYNLTHNDLSLTYSTASNLSMITGNATTMGIGRDFIVNISAPVANSVSFQTGATGSSTLNIGRDFVKKGSGMFSPSVATAGAANPMIQTYNINRNFKIEGGSIRMIGANSGGVNFVVNLKGDFLVESGQLFNNNQTTFATSNFNFVGSNQQIIYNSAATAPTYMVFNVANGSTTTIKDFDFPLGTNSKFNVLTGGTLDFNTEGTPFSLTRNTAQSGQSFELKDGGTLLISSPQGITNGGVYTGNVQVGTTTTSSPTTSSRFYSYNGIYHYKGKQDQVSGNGLPATAGAKKVIVELAGDDLKFWATPESGAGSVKRFNNGGGLEIRKGKVLDGLNPDIPAEDHGRFADEVDANATTAQSGYLKMTGGRYILYSSSFAMPQLSGNYNLTGGVIQFDGNDQSIRAPKEYLTVEITGKNVGTPNGNITLNSVSTPDFINGSLTVKNGGEFLINNYSIIGNPGTQSVIVENGGVFRTGDEQGFSGSTETSIQPSIENIVLADGSTVEYSRSNDQNITLFNPLTNDYSNQDTAGYYNLKLSGDNITNTTAKKLPASAKDEETVYVRHNLEISNAAGSQPVLDIEADKAIIVKNAIINNLSDFNNIIIESDGNLKQLSTTQGSNLGNITARRNMNLSENGTEYNYLATPVVFATGQSFKTIYPGVTGTSQPQVLYYVERTRYFYPSSGDNILGRSSAVKEVPKESVPSGRVEFKGVPYVGDFSYPLAYSATGLGFNLVGNPYPSNIDLNVLYANNKNEIDADFRFWDNKVNDNNGVQHGANYSGRAYARYNAESHESNPAGYYINPDLELTTKEPNHILKVGQGMMVQALGENKALTFSQPAKLKTIDNTDSEFFGKTSSRNRHRVVLKTPKGLNLATTTVYYAEGNDAFGKEDSKVNSNESDSFYSFTSDQGKVVINGRKSFDIEDVMPLGAAYYEAGIYTISLSVKEGIFASDQNVYLKDKQTGVITNLSAGSYTFAADAGTQTGRFEIVYKTGGVLATGGSVKGSVEVFRDGQDFVIRSTDKLIDDVELYDGSGRLVKQYSGKLSKEVRVNSEQLTNGLYVLKIVMQDGQFLSKKISH